MIRWFEKVVFQLDRVVLATLLPTVTSKCYGPKALSSCRFVFSFNCIFEVNATMSYSPLKSKNVEIIAHAHPNTQFTLKIRKYENKNVATTKKNTIAKFQMECWCKFSPIFVKVFILECLSPSPLDLGNDFYF